MKDVWKYIPFEKCLQKVPKQAQVKSKYYLETGRFPIVSQEAELISGYCDDESMVYNHKKPVIVFGDHTKNVKFIDFCFVIGADGTHILLPIDSIDSKFFYYVIKSIKLRDLGYARHYKLLKETYIPVPPLAEQQSIVEYLDTAFAKIDSLKAKAQENLKHAQALFQAALSEMMTPKDDWVDKKLPEISENLDYIRKPVTKNKRNSGIYPYYGASGIVDYVSEYLFDEDILLISEDGANLLARSSPIAFSVSGKVWVNNHAHVVRFNNLYLQRFIEYYFASIAIDAYVSGAAQPKLTQSKLNSINIPVPPTKDIKRIVSNLDKYTAKIETLKSNFAQLSSECEALNQSLLKQAFE